MTSPGFADFRSHTIAAVLRASSQLAMRADEPAGLKAARALRAVFGVITDELSKHAHIEIPRLVSPEVLLEISGLHEVSTLRALLRTMETSGELGSKLLARCFESVYGLDADQIGASMLARRERGVYFTPEPVARELVRAALMPVLAERIRANALDDVTIIDPSVGGGVFLVQALRLLTSLLEEQGAPVAALREARKRFVERAVFGVDIDPVAVHVSVVALLLEARERSIDTDSLLAHVVVGDALLPPDTGSDRQFDVVLGNPPWGRLRPDAKRFLAALDSKDRAVHGAAQGKQRESEDVGRRWREHVARCSAYTRLLDSRGIYEHRVRRAGDAVARGDADLYKYFMERALQLVRPTGRVGLVIPSGFLRSASAAAIRSHYFRSGSFERLVEFENRARVFPIHGMFRFAVMVFRRGRPGGIEAALFRQTAAASIGAIQPAVSLPRAFISKFTGELSSIPELKSRDEKLLFEKLHEPWPTLGEDHPAWKVSFKRELDMTIDSASFESAESLRASGARTHKLGGLRLNGRHYLPVYEGRMVHQFDAQAKGYVSGKGRTAIWRYLPDSRKSVAPQFFIDSALCDKTDYQQVRAGFCDITGHANERTVLAALIPAYSVCGNKVPTCRFSVPTPELNLLWVGLANSFVVDWLVRRHISTTLNFFIWKSVPFPRLSLSSHAAKEIVSRVATLSRVPDAHGKRDLRLSARLRAELDAEVAFQYRLSLSDFALVLQDFGSIDRTQAPILGEDRSTITRDLAAATYGRLLMRRRPSWARGSAVAMLRGFETRLGLGVEAGAIAYVPSEHQA